MQMSHYRPINFSFTNQSPSVWKVIDEQVLRLFYRQWADRISPIRSYIGQRRTIMLCKLSLSANNSVSLLTIVYMIVANHDRLWYPKLCNKNYYKVQLSTYYIV